MFQYNKFSIVDIFYIFSYWLFLMFVSFYYIHCFYLLLHFRDLFLALEFAVDVI